MGLEYCVRKETRGYMLGNWKLTKNMGMEYFTGLMEGGMKDGGAEENSMALVFT